MKHLVCALCGLLATVAWGRRHVDSSDLPPSPHVDTEAVTNIMFSTGVPGPREFRFSLECLATPSNNVQLAFGADANTNGVLDVEEEWLCVGWDCGMWVVRNGFHPPDGAQGPLECRFASATSTPRKRLDWGVVIKSGVPRRLALSENGTRLSVSGLGLPQWTWREEWDLVKVTVRGFDEAGENVHAEVGAFGTKIVVR